MPSLICELCSEETIYLQADFESLPTDRVARYRCDNCTPSAPRRKRVRVSEPRDDGCIVTAELPDGHVTVRHQTGPTPEALREITDALPTGSRIMSISTPRTILRDMQHTPRTIGGRGRRPQVDRYGAERTLLGKIGRIDLLPDNTT